MIPAPRPFGCLRHDPHTGLQRVYLVIHYMMQRETTLVYKPLARDHRDGISERG